MTEQIFSGGGYSALSSNTRVTSSYYQECLPQHQLPMMISWYGEAGDNLIIDNNSPSVPFLWWQSVYLVSPPHKTVVRELCPTSATFLGLKGAINVQRMKIIWISNCWTEIPANMSLNTDNDQIALFQPSLMDFFQFLCRVLLTRVYGEK